MRTDLLATLLFATVLCAARTLSAQDRLFVSAQLTPAGEYTSEIEGPAVDAAGNLYAVNLHRAGTIGEFTPGAGTSRLFATLPDGSIGSGIRFDREQRMYVADYRRHNIFVFDLGADTPKLYFHSSDFSQPNDLAMARDGTLFASDPDFARHTGRVWRIDRAADGATGAPMHSARPMGEANGIDLSPDGATLYVSETDTREIWAYRIVATRSLIRAWLSDFRHPSSMACAPTGQDVYLLPGRAMARLRLSLPLEIFSARFSYGENTRPT